MESLLLQTWKSPPSFPFDGSKYDRLTDCLMRSMRYITFDKMSKSEIVALLGNIRVINAYHTIVLMNVYNLELF